MPRLSLLGGIGAVGTAMARFFHPSEHIRAKWPNDDKRHLSGVLVVGEGMRRIQRKEQMCYLVRIDDIGEDVVLHIVKKNFKILGSIARGPWPCVWIPRQFRFRGRL